jgi:hypothetical protein
MKRAELIESLVKTLLDENIIIEEINIENSSDEVVKNGSRKFYQNGQYLITIKLLNKTQIEEFNKEKSSF